MAACLPANVICQTHRSACASPRCFYMDHCHTVRIYTFDMGIKPARQGQFRISKDLLQVLLYTLSGNANKCTVPSFLTI